MLLTQKELNLCNYSLRATAETNVQGAPVLRKLELDEQAEGVSIKAKLDPCIVDDKFVESEVEFSTMEKALLLKFMERPWGVDDAKVYLELKDKLS